MSLQVKEPLQLCTDDRHVQKKKEAWKLELGVICCSFFSPPLLCDKVQELPVLVLISARTISICKQTMKYYANICMHCCKKHGKYAQPVPLCECDGLPRCECKAKGIDL